ncbi:MAG: hypothetical protein IIU46_09450 [Treponema sp.]|nr:hypothetical protein [Treponema sp.]
MAVLIILLCIFNLVMWLLAIVRFRKIFSTDDILNKTRDELDNMMMEINRNAERNVSLIEDRIAKLKEITAETDRHIEILRQELDSSAKSTMLQSRLLGNEPKKSIVPEYEAPSVQPPKRTRSTVRKTVPKTEPEPENNLFDEKDMVPQEKTPVTSRQRGPLAAYQHEKSRVTVEKAAKTAEKSAAGDSFSKEIDAIVRRSSFEVEASDEPKAQNASGPEIIISENPIRPKKSKKDQVIELADTGMTVPEIARQLKTTTTEVEFILEMLR